MKLLILTSTVLLLSQSPAAAADWTVNSVLGDVSWIRAHTTAPGAAPERERLATHLRYVQAMLASRSDAHLDPARRMRRRQLLAALSEYAEAGEFPRRQRDGYEGRRPRFIDHHGVHCAVGYLMARSGHAELAAAIAARENYAYVSDIETPGVSQWAERHGFRLGELAMIQPGYQSPPTAEDTRQMIESIKDQLTIECAREHEPVLSFGLRVRGDGDGAVHARARGRSGFARCFAEHVESNGRGGMAWDSAPRRYRFRIRVHLTPPEQLLVRALRGRALGGFNTGCLPRPGEVPLYAAVEADVDRRSRRVRVRTWPRNDEVAQCLAEYLERQLGQFKPGRWALHASMNAALGPALSDEWLASALPSHAPNAATDCVETHPEDAPESLTLRVHAAMDAAEFEVQVSDGSEAYRTCVGERLQAALRERTRVYRRVGEGEQAEEYFRIDAEVEATYEFVVETPADRAQRVQEAREAMERERERIDMY